MHVHTFMTGPTAVRREEIDGIKGLAGAEVCATLTAGRTPPGNEPMACAVKVVGHCRLWCFAGVM
jgi:hypothetical protein